MFFIFILGFTFSFIGSIPPGTINLSVLQLSLEGHKPAALRFALAAAVFELPYAYLAVTFEELITTSPWIEANFRLLAALVMLTLGTITITSHLRKTPQTMQSEVKKYGFRKGVVLSILNPLAIPFWIGVTAYLKHQGWLALNSLFDTLGYIFAISMGTFSLLAVLALLGHVLSPYFKQNRVLNITPGVVFLLLGFYALLQYLTQS
ncbi:MAG: LysE family transporter [Bacteroidota bacterium]